MSGRSSGYRLPKRCRDSWEARFPELAA
ncbi:protein of unknown function [Micropruina glycogenica]|uniref:Uncharacterized protein n=1 Tax=Micropruina glycogenica TaxID=75385 RepID=A0A2N9JDL9_9ACTN|nr:protein of unknown function [Micropruina glycogenica]